MFSLLMRHRNKVPFPRAADIVELRADLRRSSADEISGRALRSSRIWKCHLRVCRLLRKAPAA
jgi:hypothetical protein